MKKNFKLLVFIFSVLLVVLPLLTVIISSPSMIAADFDEPLTHKLDPVYINIDSKPDFETYSSTGTGTPGDPYIIENLTRI